MNRGSWFLVQAYDPPTEDSESATVAENTGYIVFKDRKTVVFYTNDLANTTSYR